MLELARVVKTFLWLTSCCRKMRHLEVALEAAGTRGPLKEERVGDDCSWRGLGKDWQMYSTRWFACFPAAEGLIFGTSIG